MSIREINAKEIFSEDRYQLLFQSDLKKGPSHDVEGIGTSSASPPTTPLSGKIVQVYVQRLMNFFNPCKQIAGAVQSRIEGLISSVFESFNSSKKTERLPFEHILPGVLKCRFNADKKIEIIFRCRFPVGGNKNCYKVIYLTNTFPEKIGSEVFYVKPIPGKTPKETERYEKEFQKEAMRTKIFSELIPFSLPVEIAYKCKNPIEAKGMCSQIGLGSIHKLLSIIPETMPEQDRLQLFSHLFHQVAIALNKLHTLSPQYVHGDITTANIIISDCKEDGVMIPSAALIDYGQTTESGTVLRNRITAEAYAAPEQFLPKWKTDPSSDMWSFGMSILTCIFNADLSLFLSYFLETVPERKCTFDVIVNFKEKLLRDISEKDPGNTFLPLLQGLLTTNPENRFSAQKAIIELEGILKK